MHKLCSRKNKAFFVCGVFYLREAQAHSVIKASRSNALILPKLKSFLKVQAARMYGLI